MISLSELGDAFDFLVQVVRIIAFSCIILVLTPVLFLYGIDFFLYIIRLIRYFTRLLLYRGETCNTNIFRGRGMYYVKPSKRNNEQNHKNNCHINSNRSTIRNNNINLKYKNQLSPKKKQHERHPYAQLSRSQRMSIENIGIGSSLMHST